MSSSDQRLSSNSSKNNNKQTHIEVCVRLRPLVVEMNTSSSSFFHHEIGSSNSNKTIGIANQRNTSSGSSYMNRTVSSTQHQASPTLRNSAIQRPATTNVANRYLSSINQQLEQQNAIKSKKSTSPTKPSSPDNCSSNNIVLPTSSAQPTAYAWTVQGDDTVIQNPACGTDLIVGRTFAYTLDHVYGPEVSTQQLYTKSIQDRVRAAMEGYHAAILAYGQTATGKTHTMTGTIDEPGFIPLAIRECFAFIKNASLTAMRSQQVGTLSSSKGNNNDNANSEYLLRLSYVEVYKEHIKDLLVSSTIDQPPIRLFESNGNLQIRGMKEVVVTSPEQVFTILAEGESRRQVGSTHANIHSSRSHVLVRIWIESRTVTTGHEASKSSRESVRVSSLSLVDLAGSESVRLTGSSERRTEGHYINKSLMTLGQVVYALSEQNDSNTSNGLKKHVPYRDSKLTRLLQPSLSGNAQVVLLCCISPLASHIEESHNTFKFAIRAKKIPQKAIIQEQTMNDETTLLQTYRAEIEDLKQQLKDARDLMLRRSLSPVQNQNSNGSSFDEENLSDDHEMTELIDAIQKMEKLILKTQPFPSSSDDDNDDDDILFDVSNTSDGGESSSNIEARLLALTVNTDSLKPDLVFPQHHDQSMHINGHRKQQNNISRYQTPPRANVNANDIPSAGFVDKTSLHQELARIQGLLGSVIKKRHRGYLSLTTEKEVRHLRAALEQQEVVTSLRQADSSFLQAQLEEKDNLLAEVSKLLESVEERQTALEAENTLLRKELEQYKKLYS